MEQWLHGFVDSTIQCWSCDIFDRLFQIISAAAGRAYAGLAQLALIILSGMLIFYVLWVVWDNLRPKNAKDFDPTFKKSIQPVLINGLVVCALLVMGVSVPRLITTVTFEPISEMTLIYTENMLHTTREQINDRVEYKVQPMPDDGFFRPALRDRVIQLMKTTITQFQSMVHLGFAVMDNAFSWRALLGPGAIVKHFIMFIMGLYLAWSFFKLFIKFCFYFIDVIVALTLFAFFFPFSAVFFVFKESKAADWVKGLGKGVGADMFKQVVNTIVTLAAVVIIYVVAMVIIGKFFSAQGTSGVELTNLIISGQIYGDDLSTDNLAAMTLMGAIVLMYVVNFLVDKVPDISKEILTAFDVTEDKMALGNDVGDKFMLGTKQMLETIKTNMVQPAIDSFSSIEKPKADAAKDGATKPADSGAAQPAGGTNKK